MTVISNPLLLKKKAAAGGGGSAYQIEKSLRFNPGDTPHMSHTFGSKGNRRVWTWAGWIKRTGTTAKEGWFQVDGSNAMMRFNNDDGSHNIRFLDNVTNGWDLITSMKFRDPSAWFHFVCAVDTTQDTSTERVKMYVNGEQVTAFWSSGNTYPTQNVLGQFNNNVKHTFGRTGSGNDEPFDGYLADVQFIDSLQLSAAAFGSYDSTGVWNPKAFALPAPNTGTTLSSGWSGTFTSGNEATKSFDGLLTTGSNPSNTNTITWTGNIAVNQGVRIYFECADHSSAKYADIFVNGIAITPTAYNAHWDSANVVNWGANNLTEIKTTQANNKSTTIKAIEVDGVILVDGQTDLTTRDNPNNGTDWHAQITGNEHSVRTWDKMFNGVLSDGGSPASGANSTWTPAGGMKVNSRLRLYAKRETSGDNITITFTDSSTFNSFTANNTTQWYDITGASGKTIQTIYWTHSTSSSVINAVEVDGHILIDSTVDNSFHLKFNDTSSNAALGGDSFGTETIRKPGGFNADANSAKLVLAVPGDVTTDVSPSIRGSGSAKSAAAGSGALAAVSTDQSKFYGSSIKVETDKQVQYTDSTDFDFDTGDCTVEAWVRSTSNSLTLNTPIDARSSGANGFAIFFTNGNAWQVDCTGNSPVSSGTGTAAVNTWYHIALSRASGSLRFFVDGKQIGSTASNTSDWSSGKVTIGHESNQWDFQGFVNDLRVYKGVGKYTANFTPPTRNDWTVNSLTTVAPALTGSSSGTASGGKSMIVKAAGGSTVTGTFNAAGNSTGNINYYKSDNGINWTYIQQDTGESPSYTAKWLSMGGGSAAKQFTSTSGSYQYSLEGSTSLDSNTSSQTIDQTGLTFTGAINYGELDSLVDTPTNYGDEDTGAGGEIRGNYCTWNPLAKTGSSNTLSQGNLKCITTTNACTKGTFAMTSGKWYFEYTLESAATQQIGIIDATGFQDASAPGGDPHNGYIYLTNVSGNANTGHLYHNQTASITTWPSGANGDIVMIAYDADTGKLWWGKDNTWFNDSSGNTGNPATGANPAITVNADYRDRMTPVCGAGGGSDAANGTANFGQRAFKYTAPSGFKALCTQNLPNTFSGAELNNPSKYFDIITYQGTGASKTFSGLGFGPDMIWTKQRSSTGEPRIQDIIRGTNSQIRTNTNADEMTETNNVTAFTSDGYTIGTNGDINSSSHTHVAWLWDAGTAASGANDAGGIDISSGNQWANTTAGFSISRYTGTGSATTVGHGLNAVPEFIFFKRLDGDDSWPVYHKNLSGITKWLALDTSDGEQTRTDEWNEIYPTNTLVSIGPGGRKNENGVLTMMYAFTPIPGYSAFGSYEGNGNADGPFVYCGFKPRWLLIKNVDATNHWAILDTARDTYNGMDERLHPNDSMATNTGAGIVIDTLSNGFKCRNSDGLENGNNQTMIYAAFAEHPFKTARAR